MTLLALFTLSLTGLALALVTLGYREQMNYLPALAPDEAKKYHRKIRGDLTVNVLLITSMALIGFSLATMILWSI